MIYHTIHTFRTNQKEEAMKKIIKGKIFGTVTVGERGQVVIPVDVRKNFKIKSGDKLFVLANPEMFSFTPVDNFNRFLNDAAKAMARIKGKNLF
jgi:AbrB family looped-hinge helix DNA binding protein